MKYMNWQVWLIAAALAGCADNGDSGRATVGVQLALSSGSSSETPSGLEADGGELTIAHARAVVERIELFLPTGDGCDRGTGTDDHPHCGGVASDHGGHASDEAESSSDDSVGSSSAEGDKLTIRGPFVVDLVTGSTTPSIADVSVPAGRYRRIDVRFSDADEGKLPVADVLDGNTLVADGTFEATGGETTPFDLQLDFNEEARFESADGIELGAGGAAQILLQLDVSRWFSALPIAECASDLVLADGRLQLDERAQCGHIERDLKAAIKNSGRLARR